MSLSTSSPDNPGEIEIDRLLRELGIVLPDEDGLTDRNYAAGDNGEIPLITDDVGLPDADEPVSCWLPHLPDQMAPWLPEEGS